MKLGVFLPVSGRAAVPEVLTEAAQQAENGGYDSVWAAERLVNPWEMKTAYPYKDNQQWFVAPDVPFLEPLTCLSFLSGVTKKVKLGISVAVLPYRHPLYTARVATSIDTLSNGRLILGVGIGWMVEEFDALGVPLSREGRGPMSNCKFLTPSGRTSGRASTENIINSTRSQSARSRFRSLASRSGREEKANPHNSGRLNMLMPGSPTS